MEPNYPFSTERSSLLGTEAFRNLLAASLKNAKKSVIILSAYVKEVGVKWMQEQITDINVKCTIIARWDKSDLAQGSSDLGCYHLAKERNWDFKILKDLHAKVMLVDNKDLFIGSTNLTGHGMSLVPVSNKEMGIKLQSTKEDVHTIRSLLEEAYKVNDKLFNQLKKWKEELPKIKTISYPDFPQEIRDKIKENYKKIWIHNFPWSTPENLLNIKKMNENIIHDLELFGLKKEEINKEKLQSAFQQSKIYKWLVNQILNSENKEIYFGNLSSIIHNSLLDDPTPYRKTIKEIQSNLYVFIRTLDINIGIDIPFAKSERMKLKQ
jgi:hypothetical protein